MSADLPMLQRAVQAALAAAKRRAPDASLFVWAYGGRSANLRYARDEVTSSADVFNTTVSIWAQFGLRHANASTNQVDAASLDAVVDKALRMAKLSPEDPETVPVLGAQKYKPMPTAWDDATAKADAQARESVVERAVQRSSQEALQLAAYLEVNSGTMVLGSSNGLRASHDSTSADVSVTARSVEGAGSGWASAWSKSLGDLDAARAGKVAQDKAVRSRKPTPIEPGRYTVILEPAAVSELLGYLVWSMDARSADEGRSFFSKPGGGTKLGEALFGPGITIRSPVGDPTMPCAPFTHVGLPVEPITWIDQGKVSALRYSRFWAQKQGKKPTASPDTLELLGGEAESTDALLKGVKRGLYVTRFWYSNMVTPETLLATGLTRDGVFLVENGEVVRPVTNFRWNESPLTMLKNADAMTKQLFRLNSYSRVPALRTHDFNMASASEAV